MAPVSFRGITKEYDNGVVAVSTLDLEIPDGEFLVLVGPSGCGKSTALRMVAGLEEITDGDLEIGGRRVNHESPAKRNVAMVFQNYALYPHMTVRKNMELALKLRRVNKADRAKRVSETAAILGLTELLERKPAQLSGGQRQRVAMGRAIVRDPSVFLLDEPLSNLDAKLRVQMRAEISQLQARLNATTIFVTHDQVEALTMAHRVAIMRRGVLQQVGPPQELFDRPRNLFVADFIGSPSMNFLAGRLEASGDAVSLVYGGSERLALPAEVAPGGSPRAALVGRDAIVGVRPEHLDIAEPGAGAAGLAGRVQLVEPLGGEVLVHVEVAAAPVLADELRDVAADVDPTALAQLERARTTRFTVRRQGTDAPAVDEAVRLVVRDPRRVHLFDPETALAVV